MEKEIWEIVKALDKKKLTAIEAHKKLCSLYFDRDVFEVGIEVKITKRINGHGFKIGEVVKIIDKEIDGNNVFWWCGNSVDKWCIEEDEAKIYYC